MAVVGGGRGVCHIFGWLLNLLIPFVGYAAGAQEADNNKKDKEFEIIDLTLDSDSESDGNDYDDDNDDSEQLANERDLNTPR